jgi:hypothetical protein
MSDTCRKCGSWTELTTAGICAGCYGGATSAPGPIIQYAPCPQCARFREKIDREKMAVRLWELNIVPEMREARAVCDVLIAYLTE